MIFLIEKLWLDPLENSSSQAFGYQPIGYVTTLQHAAEIVSKGGTRIGNGWPLRDGVEYPNMTYKKVQRLP